MTLELDASKFLIDVYDVTEQLAVDIQEGVISVPDARITCLQGIAAAFGLEVEVHVPEEADDVVPGIEQVALDDPIFTKVLVRSSSPAEVAARLGVVPKTVTRWAKEGKIPHVKTLGGHHRFLPEHVQIIDEMMGIQDIGEE